MTFEQQHRDHQHIRNATIRECLAVVGKLSEDDASEAYVTVTRALKAMLTGREVIPPLDPPFSWVKHLLDALPGEGEMSCTTPIGTLMCSRFRRGRTDLICTEFWLDNLPVTRAEMRELGLDQRRTRARRS